MRYLVKFVWFLLFCVVGLGAAWFFRAELSTAAASSIAWLTSWVGNIETEPGQATGGDPEDVGGTGTAVDRTGTEAADQETALGGEGQAEAEETALAATAASVEERLSRLASGPEGLEMSFTEAELQSYLQSSIAIQLPDGVSEPTVTLADSTITLTATLVFARLPIDSESSEPLIRMLGDSARVSVEGRLEIGASGQTLVHLISARAGRLPVPGFLLGPTARSLGLRSEGNTVLIPFDIPGSHVSVEGGNLTVRKE